MQLLYVYVFTMPEGEPRKPGKYNQLVLWHDRNVLCQRVVFRVYLLVDKSLKCETDLPTPKVDNECGQPRK